MPLTLMDLQQEKDRLKKIMDHTARELEAIEVLIEGAALRGQGQAKQDTAGISVRKLVELIHKEEADRWFSGADMVDEILRRDPSKKVKTLRANVGNSQRNLFGDGAVDRDNRGTDLQPNYVYRWKG